MNSEKFDRQLRIWGRKGQTEIENTKILIVGAGGIGSEVVKNLVFLGFQNLIIVDMDKVEISNLNRQMFFDKSDQGKYKAETLVKKINKINPNGNYNYINDKIQNVDRDIFEKSDYIISALDNLAARIWLNESCVELKKTFIDGGAEGFIGHVQVVIPGITPCLMCQNLWILRTEKFKCNYAINPRTPEDCALEARDRFFLKFKRSPDLENQKELEILFELADVHAKKHGIIGITTPKIIDTLKNTVAQIITTNSIIGTIISNELLKIVLRNVKSLDLALQINTLLQYNGLTGNMWAVPLEKNENCLTCSKKIFRIEADPSMPLESLVEYLGESLKIEMISPTLILNERMIYRFKGSRFKEENQRLEKLKTIELNDIIKNGDILYIEDEETSLNFKLKITFATR